MVEPDIYEILVWFESVADARMRPTCTSSSYLPLDVDVSTGRCDPET